MEYQGLKVATILGTRPEIIRLSSVIPALDARTDHRLVHTGQNYDYELNEILFRDLKLRKPDYFLGVDTSSVGAAYGNILIETEKTLIREKPDAVLILGDTNSSIAAIIAKRMRIPVYHMEAGNRSFDLNVPEEINRRIVDHVSDFNLVYTERARLHLLAEGLPHRRIYLTGSPMNEVLHSHQKEIESSNALNALGLTKNGYYLVSIHREENVDDPQRLQKVLASLQALARAHQLPLIVSTHPRTRKHLRVNNLNVGDEQIQFLKPFGFFDYIKLQTQARCVVSDSGTISEESSILNFPAVTLRDSMERPEALDMGSMTMAPLEPAEALLESVENQLEQGSRQKDRQVPWEYTIENTSERVVNLIISTARLSNAWDGIRPYTSP